ncbi:CRISP/Allergen/PR-1-like [Colias croceus]|uniref:CRISP/Allergen/PR-1-like n=1 Tax=Colias crocea TaxID=72248 RepID=UPI001E27B6D7|nr:CRISP/Allergen/PR-1-like [Colias croceus]
MHIALVISSIFIWRLINCDSNNVTIKLQDYCNHPDCSLKNQHTMCVAKNKHSSRLFASGMTMWTRYQLLLLHNRHRDNIAMGLEPGQPPAANMRKMYWDYELEELAETWAQQCQKRHDECRNTIRFNVLQNLDVRPVVPRVTEAQLLADAVGAWFSGSRALHPDYVWSFRLSNCSAPGGCNAHWYSAAAWASTWRLGCSQALCTAKKRSCVHFRKRRTLSTPTDGGYVTRTSTSSENILRRTKFTPGRSTKFQDFNVSNDIDEKESPLHRGMFEVDGKQKKREEPQILAFTVCNYGPAGNIEGFPIYEAGTTCSNCPQGTLCGDRMHRGLCIVSGDPEGKKRKT